MKIRTFFLYSIVSLLILNTALAQQADIIADGAKLTLVAEGYSFTEGPAVDKAGNVYFTDQPNDRILKWDAEQNTVSEYMSPSGRSNGLYVDDDGNLLSAADEKNELWRIDPDKKVTVLVKDFEGEKLNGPNDLWADNKGGIYFTDPYYQRTWWEHTEPQQKAKRVYYLAKGAETPQIVAENFEQPNGIIGTPDGNTLYVTDIRGEKTFSFNIDDDGTLSNRSLFCDMGSDGMTIDNEGNVYLTGEGVTVFDKNGKQIDHIAVPEKWTANITFGGPDQKTLFITASDAVYTLKMKVHGVRW